MMVMSDLPGTVAFNRRDRTVKIIMGGEDTGVAVLVMTVGEARVLVRGLGKALVAIGPEKEADHGSEGRSLDGSIHPVVRR